MRLFVLLTNTAAPPASVRGVWDVMLKAQGSGSEPIGNFIEDRLEAEAGGQKWCGGSDYPLLTSHSFQLEICRAHTR